MKHENKSSSSETTASQSSVADRIRKRVASAPEPFIVPDVTEAGESPAAVWHVLRDLCDDGVLVHTGEGYRKTAFTRATPKDCSCSGSSGSEAGGTDG